MPRPRKSAAAATIAFFGTAEMDPDHAAQLIEEYLTGQGLTVEDPVRFWFPVITDEYTETMGELVEIAKDTHIPYEVITSPTDRNRRAHQDAIKDATKNHSAEDPVALLERELSNAPGAALFMLWDKEREDELQEIADTFLAAGVKVFDISDALTPIGPSEETTEAQPGLEAMEEGHLYTEEELQQLGRSDLRDICEALGIQPKRASASTIEAILEAQEGEPEEEGEEEGEPEDEVEEEVVEPGAAVNWEPFMERLEYAFDGLVSRLDALVKSVTPPVPSQPQRAREEPQEPAQPARRRLARVGARN